MSPRAIKLIACYVLALAVLGLDQWVKHWVDAHLALYQSMPVVPGYFALTYVRNIGAAFSLFSGKVPVLAAVAGTVAIAIVVYLQRLKPVTIGHALSLGLLLGGTLGNFHDRLRLGYVIDMFDLQWGGRNIWPIFNIADMGIDVGVAILLLVFLWESRQAASTPESPPSEKPLTP